MTCLEQLSDNFHHENALFMQNEMEKKYFVKMQSFDTCIINYAFFIHSDFCPDAMQIVILKNRTKQKEHYTACHSDSGKMPLVIVKKITNIFFYMYWNEIC